MTPILAFDVNEPLLDVSALDVHFERGFGNPAVRKEWFSQVLQLAFASTVTGPYVDFGTIMRAALRVVEEKHHTSLSSDQRSAIVETVGELPPHTDAKDGLERLRDGGLGLVALTNSTLATARKQLRHAGLANYFQRIFSADEVHRLKPAPEPYHLVARELGVEVQYIWLVAAHSWDVAGALRAGLRAAFIARPGQVLDELTPKPNLIAKNLRDFAQQVLALQQAA